MYRFYIPSGYQIGRPDYNKCEVFYESDKGDPEWSFRNGDMYCKIYRSLSPRERRTFKYYKLYEIASRDLIPTYVVIPTRTYPIPDGERALTYYWKPSLQALVNGDPLLAKRMKIY